MNEQERKQLEDTFRIAATKAKTDQAIGGVIVYGAILLVVLIVFLVYKLNGGN
jgi:hypothetical protein